MPHISFLLDENVSLTIADFLRQRGHVVQFARDVVVPPRHDILVAAAADHLSAIVITRNHKHFRQLRRYVPGEPLPRFPNAGRISLKCPDEIEAARVAELIDVLEAEYDIVQQKADKRVIAEIQTTQIVIVR